MQLPHLIGTKSAAQDGVMMFDPAAGVPVFSQDGVWVELQGAVLTAPDLGQWRIVVDNAGNLSTVAA